MDHQEERGHEPLKSRRALLTGALGGVAALAAAALGQARPVEAHHATVGLGHLNEDADLTQIKNTTDGGTAFWGKATGGGLAIIGDTQSGVGVAGWAESGIGVGGSSTSGTAVDGLSETGVGTVGASGTNYGLFGSSNENVAVWAQTASQTRPAVYGWSYQGNTGLFGVSGLSTPPGAPDGPVKTGVFGYAAQDAAAAGVRGTSPLGRGGVFKGGAAAVRLMPSTNTGHPASGQKGDLFVDSTGRLWFCKGGTTWVRIV